jgi:hypothetical protein
MAGIERTYGRTLDWFVLRKTSVGGATLVIGGTAQDAIRWTRVLTERAARMLWFSLTQGLFPEQSDRLTARLATLPMRPPLLPTITNQLWVESCDEGHFELVGLTGGHTWTARLDRKEAERLWTALNQVLFPLTHGGT